MRALTALFIGISFWTHSLVAQDPFIQHMNSQVTETITHSEKVPGLNSDEFKALKAGISERWKELVERGVLEVSAPDKDVRPYFVALQGIVEHALSCELHHAIRSLTGVIHTPMPATPLCTDGSISPELVDPSIANDPLRLFTVKARVTILRDYLYQGGNLYIVYPKEGLAKRTQTQQQIYKKELANYPNNLFDRPLDCDALENDLIGAFYIFENAEGKQFAFAIQMTQANQPQDTGHFGIWFGEIGQTPVSDRITKVLEMIRKYAQEPITFTDLVLSAKGT